MPAEHIPVLLNEVLQHLPRRDSLRCVDATFGRGGHSAHLRLRLGEQGHLLLLDRDLDAVAVARQLYAEDPQVSIEHADFAELAEVVAARGEAQSYDTVLLDLGVSSPQLDRAERGFSFMQDGPLDMRMDTSRGQSAADWLRLADEKDIARVLWEFGEERQSRRIARRIVETRDETPLTRTAQLAELIRGCCGAAERHKHPATRSFQAIRIHVNQELQQLQQVLEQIFAVLKIGGRLLVISFHSLEDRMVKRFIRDQSTPPKIPKRLPVKELPGADKVRLRAIGKAIRSNQDELQNNPRARSAVLRVAERLA